jgi:uncharacterized protein (UPF0276 family)
LVSITSAVLSAMTKTDGDVLVDAHSVGIDADASDLYDYVVDRIGSRPTLIEWDNDLPDLAPLLPKPRAPT